MSPLSFYDSSLAHRGRKRLWRWAGLTATVAVWLLSASCGGGTDSHQAPPAAHPGELIILGQGQTDARVRRAIREHAGQVVRYVRETHTYTVRFHVDDQQELIRLREELRKEGVDAQLALPPHPND